MARLKIEDLPKNLKISEEELKKVTGGTVRIGYAQSLTQRGYDIGPTGRIGYDIGPTG